MEFAHSQYNVLELEDKVTVFCRPNSVTTSGQLLQIVKSCTSIQLFYMIYHNTYSLISYYVYAQAHGYVCIPNIAYKSLDVGTPYPRIGIGMFQMSCLMNDLVSNYSVRWC